MFKGFLTNLGVTDYPCFSTLSPCLTSHCSLTTQPAGDWIKGEKIKWSRVYSGPRTNLHHRATL